MSSDGWVATEWMHESQINNSENYNVVKIVRIDFSCYYDGVRYIVILDSGNKCINKFGGWEYTKPEKFDEDYIERCRFKDFKTACKIAENAIVCIKKEQEQFKKEREAKRKRGPDKALL